MRNVTSGDREGIRSAFFGLVASGLWIVTSQKQHSGEDCARYQRKNQQRDA